MKQYSAILIDWDDTIGDWSHAAACALRDLYDDYCLNELFPTLPDFIGLYEPYNLELWDRYGRNEVTKAQLHFERFYYPLMQADNNPSFHGEDKQSLALRMGDDFLRLTNKYFTLLPDAEMVVTYLAGRYPLTVLSNGFKEVQYYKLAHSGLQDRFSHIVISEELGFNKPDPRLFSIALRMNNVSAQQAIMIGDSYTSDIAGAKAAGIDQLWIHKEPTEQNATYIVPKLADVMTIL